MVNWKVCCRPAHEERPKLADFGSPSPLQLATCRIDAGARAFVPRGASRRVGSRRNRRTPGGVWHMESNHNQEPQPGPSRVENQLGTSAASWQDRHKTNPERLTAKLVGSPNKGWPPVSPPVSRPVSRFSGPDVHPPQPPQPPQPPPPQPPPPQPPPVSALGRVARRAAWSAA